MTKFERIKNRINRMSPTKDCEMDIPYRISNLYIGGTIREPLLNLRQNVIPTQGYKDILEDYIEKDRTKQSLRSRSLTKDERISLKLISELETPAIKIFIPRLLTKRYFRKMEKQIKIILDKKTLIRRR